MVVDLTIAFLGLDSELRLVLYNVENLKESGKNGGKKGENRGLISLKIQLRHV